MGTNVAEFAPRSSSSGVCIVCHQPLLPQYYFCPNCGTPVHPVPLSTSFGAQLLMYAHSIILPMVLFLSVSRWQGYKYFKSADRKAKQVGTAAIILLVLSTVITSWFAYVWTQEAIQSSIDSINSDMSI